VKLAVLTKLRTRLWRDRDRAWKDLDRERDYSPLNHNRPRLRGRIATLEEVHDHVDRLIKSAHDRFHDRRKKRA
jgi:hypothetical protein